MSRGAEFIFFMMCWAWGAACADTSNISQQMVNDVRNQFIDFLEESGQSRARAQRIFEIADEKAEACVDVACAYSFYINGIYEAVDIVGSGRRCPLSARMLAGVWVSTTSAGYYEKITLSLYRGRPSVHQFIAFKSASGNRIDDGFGGWVWRGCKVKTIQHTSGVGRVFFPGNELVVLSYSKSANVITLLDGDFLASFVRQK